ncbi:MAG: hypothetical protein WCS65_02120 [Verrucomicrobiae bacterium]
MKTSQQDICLAQIFRFARIACALIAIAALSACASVTSFFKTTDSSLPVETIASSGGEVSSARAYESSDRLYISGHIKKSLGRHIPYAAHVDVQLIDNAERVISEKQDDIDPHHPNSGGSRSGEIGYVASFPVSEARKAAKIVIRYHLDGHQS